MGADVSSRNQREGIYAGFHAGHHVRAQRPATTVWMGGEVLFVCPVPSSDVAWGVQYRRLTMGEHDDES